MSLVAWGVAQSPNRFETLILYGSPDKKEATQQLLHLQNYLQTQQISPSLHAHLKKEGTLYMVTIQPITNLQQRNHILRLLQPHFPDAFYIEERGIAHTRAPKKISSVTVLPSPSSDDLLSNYLHLFIAYIDWVWFAIGMLATIGLIASLIHRYKLKRLSKKQQEIKKKQQKIEDEIHQMRRE